jgi:pimeloyl-ACP methyl ester carboxylesterase
MRLAAAVLWLVLAAVAAAAAGPAAASPYGLLDGLDEPLAYCDGTLGAAALGAVTDGDYGGPVTEAPLPAGVTQRRLTVDGVTTRVLEAGPATAEEAVVFVHGNPDSARDWDALLASTGRFGRAVAFDMPGYGRADDRRGLDYSTTGAARFIGRVVEELGIRRVHLVGHDFGGIWGLQWAVGDLAALRSVTLLDSGALIGAIPHPTALTFSTPLAGEAFMAATNRAGFRAVIEAQNPLPDPFLDRLYDDYDRATRCAILHYYRSVDSADALGRAQAPILRRADLPALVVWGQRDPYTPVALARRQTQAFPHARIEILPKVGHWPQVEAPAQTERLVTGFLRDLVRMPRLVATPLRARAGNRRLSVCVRVSGAARTPAVRLRLLHGGRLVGAARARTVDDRARRIAIALRRPLRRGRYTLELTSAELPRQTQALRIR